MVGGCIVGVADNREKRNLKQAESWLEKQAVRGKCHVARKGAVRDDR